MEKSSTGFLVRPQATRWLTPSDSEVLGTDHRVLQGLRPHSARLPARADCGGAPIGYLLRPPPVGALIDCLHATVSLCRRRGNGWTRPTTNLLLTPTSQPGGGFPMSPLPG